MSDQQASPLFNFSNAYNSKALLTVLGQESVSYWIKSFPIPSITLDNFKVPRTPHAVAQAGNIFTFSEIDVTLFVDEDFKVWKTLYEWIFGAINGKDFVDPKRDGYILILNNTLTRPVIKFNFKDLIPSNISSIEYNNFEPQEITVTCTFSYTKMTPEYLIT